MLSGTASDGTRGLKAIKDYGGITFAQDEASAAYEGMPQSAIQAGVVDFVLPPEEIVLKLLEIKKQLQLSDEELQNLPHQDEEVFKQILAILRVRKRTDFTYYKQSTIRRRILRRIAINKLEEPADYLQFLKKHKTEQDLLFQDMLIPVTAFFRDSKVYEHLCATVFPQIMEQRADGEAIRVWVAACSTGEEAYSMAICLKSLMGDELVKVQIFATDISEPAIVKARSGIYTKNEIEGLPDNHLEEYFTKIPNGYQVNREIRDMCVFAVHDFLNDPPFGRIDLVSCRNVLIYMEPYLQKKALTTFHYSLKPKGFLLLGKSETSGSVPDLFAPADKHIKIFVRKDVPGRFMQVNNPHNDQSLNDDHIHPANLNLQTDFQKTADDILLSRYTPAGVVINEAMDIVHFRGTTGLYLEQQPGKPSHNLLKMARSGLAFELRNMLHKAKKTNLAVEIANIPLIINGQQHIITIEAIPLPNIVEPHYLILFHETAAHLHIPGGKTRGFSKTKLNERDLYINQLEKEIAQNREDMRRITEDQEAANEELQSSNEELLSGSEELQSLNEELETSKEELQSTNEELLVVNQELVNLNEQVTSARNYAESIVATIHEPMLVLEKDLRVRSANQAFYDIFRVTEPVTKGFPLYELGNGQWNIPRLRELLENILVSSKPLQDFELTHVFPVIGEKIMMLNATKIIRDNPDEELILLAINDITEVRTKSLAVMMLEKDLLRKDIDGYKLNKDILENDVAERTKELNRVNKELVFQNAEKEKRADELAVANAELAYQNKIKAVLADELVLANTELLYQNKIKAKLADELVLANTELVYQNAIKAKLADELVLANTELIFQNAEKEKRATELMIANKELESFTYISSHDMQEPLRKIQTFTKLILDKEYDILSEKGKVYFQRIENSAQRMRQLITDLLDFSSVKTAERKFEKTDLRVIVQEVKNDFKEVLKEKEGSIEIGEMCPATVIPFQLRQLMQNLISNAIKFSDPGRPPHIVVQSELTQGSILKKNYSLGNKEFSLNKIYCHISVADNGIGFEEEYKERIFDLFQRLHGKADYPGTGIGLSIVKKIVENHSGFIIASSKPDQGACFDIFLPVVE